MQYTGFELVVLYFAVHAMRTLLTPIIVLTFLFPASSAAAQSFGRNKVQYDSFDFRTFETAHFQWYYYPEERDAVEDAARMGERWYRRHSRTFLREFHERKPVIFYANDADFQQTNTISGFLGQGTGGVTESLKERVIMPLTGIYSETDHVLGHELVHSFQYDIGLSRADSSRFSLQLLPLWLVEGMAEYLSVGREDVHTAMWMRDAALRDDIPTVEDLTRSNKYFPYRYGQAILAYIGGKYGDAAVTNIFKMSGRTGVDTAFVYTLGITADSLSSEWAQVIKESYLPIMEGRTHPDSAGHRILAADISGGDLNISPSVSPDGQYVAYLSERDVFSINLFIADATTGKTIRRLQATSTNPHFDNIRYINSAGSWAPDGRKFVFITFVQGDNELAIWDLDSGVIERRIRVEGVSALSNPAWSPDGDRIAFSGIDGGISDLYVYSLSSGSVRQITADRYADLHPAWSPDGATIAVVSDRGPDGSDFDALSYAKPRLSLIDVETGEYQTVRPFDRGKHTNPQFSPDGRSLFFIADRDGFSDVYRLNIASSEVFRVTRIQTGVSGITSLSPAMSVAAQNGRMLFSVFHDSKYNVFGLDADQTAGIPAVTTPDHAIAASVLPPFSAYRNGLVSNYLEDPLTGLPEPTERQEEAYNSRLRLDYVAPPSVGVSVGGLYGGGLAGGVGFYFSDMLGNENLTLVAQANGTFKDIGGHTTYMNRGKRFNYGGAIGHIPLLYGGVYPSFDQFGNYSVFEQRYRIYLDQVLGIGSYPLSTTRRVEVFSGFTRYGFDYEIWQYQYDFFGGAGRTRTRAPKCSSLAPDDPRNGFCEPDAEYFVQAGAAYVGDFSNFGFTSPLQGGRYRFEVAPRIGTNTFVAVLADYRRYLFWRPFTLAIRGMHTGNYGAQDSDVFAREYLGYWYFPGFVRGYSVNSFDLAEECLPRNQDPECSVYTRLFGTRTAVLSAELRVPVFGNETLGLLEFPYLPTELTGFLDAGLAWDKDDRVFDLLKFERDTVGRVPVVSAGTSARFNLFGYFIFEIYYAYPFQRPVKGAHFGFLLAPGW